MSATDLKYVPHADDSAIVYQTSSATGTKAASAVLREKNKELTTAPQFGKKESGAGRSKAIGQSQKQMPAILSYASTFAGVMVPVGMIATAGSLIGGLRAMVKGNSASQNFFMRGRILAQFGTVVAICGTMAITGLYDPDRYEAAGTLETPD